MSILNIPLADPQGILEVDIYKPDGVTMLDRLEGATNINFQIQLNQPGAGSFVINKNDIKATKVNLATGNLVRIKVDGTYGFAFWIEEPEQVEAAPGGLSGETFTVQGRGYLAYLARAVIYPPNWPTWTTNAIVYTSKPAGYIIADQITKAKARGAIPVVPIDFTTTHDSGGNAWSDVTTQNLHIGGDLLTVALQLGSLNAIYFDVDYSAAQGTLMHIRCWTVAHFGTDRSASVVLRAGKHLGDEPSHTSKHFAGILSRVLVEGLSGLKPTEVVNATHEADPTIGRREGYVNYATSDDATTLTSAGNALIDNTFNLGDALTLSVLHGTSTGEYTPFHDYSMADLITVDIPGWRDREQHRIVGIDVTQHTTGEGDYQINLHLTGISLPIAVRLKNTLVGGSAGQIIGGLGGGGSFPSGGGGGACCGGEILMAEAYTTTALSLTGDQTVLTIPVTVDTANARIKVVVHCGITLVTGTVQPLSVDAIGPDGTSRGAPLGQNSSGGVVWSNATFEIPPLAVIVPGAYSITLEVTGSGGFAYDIGYQVLVYLVTSG